MIGEVYFESAFMTGIEGPTGDVPATMGYALSSQTQATPVQAVDLSLGAIPFNQITDNLRSLEKFGPALGLLTSIRLRVDLTVIGTGIAVDFAIFGFPVTVDFISTRAAVNVTAPDGTGLVIVTSGLQQGGNLAFTNGTTFAPFSTQVVEHGALVHVLGPTGTLQEGTLLIDFETLDVVRSGNTGKLASDGSQIAFGNDVIALSNPGGLDFVRLYDFGGRSGGEAGVVGFQTAIDAMPGGSASYLGRAEVLATDATGIYTLTGEAIIDADFAGNAVTVRLVKLGGQAQGVSGSGLAVTQVPAGGEVRLSGAEITEKRFTGGTPAVFGTPFAVEGSLRDTGSAGSFFGPGADEVGGVVAIDDAGSLRIRGRFVAD